MTSTQTGMTIGTLARKAGVGVETVRYYQRRGLMHEPERPYGGIRRYFEPDLRRLRFIRHARDLGFSLDEAGELLQIDDGVECEQAQRIAAEKQAQIRQRIEHLERIQTTLDSLLEQCRERKTAKCPMIATLEAPAGGPPARLTGRNKPIGKRKLGLLDGQFSIPEDFNAPRRIR